MFTEVKNNVVSQTALSGGSLPLVLPHHCLVTMEDLSSSPVFDTFF